MLEIFIDVVGSHRICAADCCCTAHTNRAMLVFGGCNVVCWVFEIMNSSINNLQGAIFQAYWFRISQIVSIVCLSLQNKTSNHSPSMSRSNLKSLETHVLITSFLFLLTGG